MKWQSLLLMGALISVGAQAGGRRRVVYYTAPVVYGGYYYVPTVQYYYVVPARPQTYYVQQPRREAYPDDVRSVRYRRQEELEVCTDEECVTKQKYYSNEWKRNPDGVSTRVREGGATHVRRTDYDHDDQMSRLEDINRRLDSLLER